MDATKRNRRHESGNGALTTMFTTGFAPALAAASIAFLLAAVAARRGRLWN